MRRNGNERVSADLRVYCNTVLPQRLWSHLDEPVVCVVTVVIAK